MKNYWWCVILEKMFQFQFTFKDCNGRAFARVEKISNSNEFEKKIADVSNF